MPHPVQAWGRRRLTETRWRRDQTVYGSQQILDYALRSIHKKSGKAENHARPLCIGLALSSAPILGGCSLSNMALFAPAGAVGAAQRDLIIFTLLVMLFVFVPVVFCMFFFAWRYRASSTKAAYRPRWSESGKLEFFLWGGPIVILCVLAYASYYTSVHLDPYNTIASHKSDPVQVNVIGMSWKWLFIYPQYNIATVNQLAMPVNTPIVLNLTTDTVMMGIMIPRLGSQILVMSGMRTQLNLKPTRTGTFFGMNYQYNGQGFHTMKFHAISMSEEDFKAWIKKVQTSDGTLDWQRYSELTEPSAINDVMYFSSVRPHLFSYVISLYHTGHPRNRTTKLAASGSSDQLHATTAER